MGKSEKALNVEDFNRMLEDIFQNGGRPVTGYIEGYGWYWYSALSRTEKAYLEGFMAGRGYERTKVNGEWKKNDSTET